MLTHFGPNPLHAELTAVCLSVCGIGTVHPQLLAHLPTDDTTGCQCQKDNITHASMHAAEKHQLFSITPMHVCLQAYPQGKPRASYRKSWLRWNQRQHFWKSRISPHKLIFCLFIYCLPAINLCWGASETAQFSSAGINRLFKNKLMGKDCILKQIEICGTSDIV